MPKKTNTAAINYINFFVYWLSVPQYSIYFTDKITSELHEFSLTFRMIFIIIKYFNMKKLIII